MPADFRIPRTSVHGMDDYDFFWAIIEPLWPDASVVDELAHIAKATPGQRAVYVTTLFTREVSNGGLEQFFTNSSGMYSASVQVAFELLGAATHQAAFERALSLFPNGVAPVDWRERIGAMEAIPHRQAQFEQIEQDLFGEKRLWPYFRAYIAAHPSDFFLG